MTLHLDHLIPLRDAAKLFGLSEKRLHELVQAGKIKGAILPGGEIGVSKDAAEINAINEKLRAIKRKQFDRLRNVPITITDASNKYSIQRDTILLWVNKQRYIKILKTGYRMEIDEADVAYCAAIYELRRSFIGQSKERGQTGAPLLDEMGDPYLLKHPKLSEYRRKKKPLAK